ncbi:MAG: HEAT repeat domain-containing protein, partial [Chromatiales bacterium]|nr:HEAT repeat domain-containing protein [Chromatiales bacterium]
MNLRNQTISALESLHQSGDEVDRCNVIRTLGVLKATESVPLLIKSLRDEDVDVCIDAAENLGKIGSTEAVPSLIESLENDPDGDVRTAVVNAIGEIALQNTDNANAVEVLLNIAQNRPENLEFLGEWDDYWDMQLNAVKALGQLGIEKSVPIMKEIITSDDHQDIESEVLTALAQIGRSGHELLGERLKSAPDRDRRRAAQAFGHASTKESLSTLAEGLLDSAGEVREATLQSLAKRQATQYIKAILVYLRDPDPEVKTAAIEAIALLGKDGAGLINGQQISEKLLPLLSDVDSQVRITALQFIANFSRIEAFSTPLQRAIHKALSDDTAAVAEVACDTVAKLQDQSVVPDLLVTLARNDIQPSVRRQAAFALGTMPQCSKEIIEALITAITAPQQPVRLGALQALSQIIEENKATDDSVIKTLLSAASRELIQEEAEVESNENENGDLSEQNEEEASQASAEIDSEESQLAAANIANEATPSEEKTVSTLDAILQRNTEMEAEFNEDGSSKIEEPPEETDEESEDAALQEFYNIIDTQKKSSGRRKKITSLPLAQDVQMLAIRMLANLKSDTVQELLIELLSSDDEMVQNEAVISIEELVRKSNDKASQVDLLGPLINRLEYGSATSQIHA